MNERKKKTLITPQSLIEQEGKSYVTTREYCKWITFTGDCTKDECNIHLAELANIPQVKALIHAAQFLAFEAVDIRSQDALQEVYNALAPFKSLP